MLTDINGSIVSVLWNRGEDENTHGSLDLSPVHWAAALGAEWECHQNLGCLLAHWEVPGGVKGVWAEALSLGEGHRDTELPGGPSSLTFLCFPRL